MKRVLDQLVTEFQTQVGDRWSTPQGAAGECASASRWFAKFLALSGFPCVVLRCEEWIGDLGPDAAAIWRSAHPADLHHCVVQVGNKVYDWTARQFDGAADYPRVCRTIDLSLDWRLVEDIERYSDGAMTKITEDA